MGRDQRDQLSVGSIGGELNSRVQIRKNSKKHTQYNLAKVLFIVYIYIYIYLSIYVLMENEFVFFFIIYIYIHTYIKHCFANARRVTEMLRLTISWESGKSPASELPNLPGQVMASWRTNVVSRKRLHLTRVLLLHLTNRSSMCPRIILRNIVLI